MGGGGRGERAREEGACLHLGLDVVQLGSVADLNQDEGEEEGPRNNGGGHNGAPPWQASGHVEVLESVLQPTHRPFIQRKKKEENRQGGPERKEGRGKGQASAVWHKN
jgi:hypothetical protein